MSWAEIFFFHNGFENWQSIVAVFLPDTLVKFILSSSSVLLDKEGITENHHRSRQMIFLGRQLTNGRDHQEHISHGYLSSKNMTSKNCIGKTLLNITVAH